MFKKSIFRSNTTKAVSGAALAGNGFILGTFATLRHLGWLPWSEDMDVTIAIIVSGVVIPSLSRAIKGLMGKFW